MVRINLYLSLILLSLLVPTVEQCCAGGCAETEYCLCNTTSSFDVCASMVNSTTSNFTITDSPMYFYFAPQLKEYALLQLTFCGSPISGVNNSLLVTVEQQPGDYPTASNSQSATFPTSSTCQTLYLIDQEFGNMSNGQRQNLLLMLNLTAVGSENMSIWVEGQEKVGSYLIPILLSCIGALLVVLVVIMAVYLKRRCDAKKAANLTNDLSHLDTLMPVKRLEQVSSSPSVNCAVCLVDILPPENTRSAPCAHFFHELCINDWCKKNMNCPVCREDFSNQALTERLRRSVQPK